MSGSQLAALCGAAAVIAAVAPARPRRNLRPLPGLARGADQAARGAGARSVAAALGGAARRRLGRRADPAADRRWGRSILVACVLLLVEPLLVVGWVAACAVASVMRRRRVQQGRHRALVDELPEVVDLLGLAASSGLTVPLALEVVAARGVGEVAAALGRARLAATRGAALADALAELVVEVGEEGRPLVRVLGGALRDGTSVVPVLERLAGEVRTDRRRATEERARALPVRLLFPLVVCVLPAFALLTVVPLLAGALQGLPR